MHAYLYMYVHECCKYCYLHSPKGNPEYICTSIYFDKIWQMICSMHIPLPLIMKNLIKFLYFVVTVSCYFQAGGIPTDKPGSIPECLMRRKNIPSQIQMREARPPPPSLIPRRVRSVSFSIQRLIWSTLMTLLCWEPRVGILVEGMHMFWYHPQASFQEKC